MLKLPKIFPVQRQFRGQSFLELALVLPVLILMLLGLVEVAFFIGRYLDVLDLTREAARFASVRDPFSTGTKDRSCSTANAFDFYWDTGCIFSPPETAACRAASNPWCNGLNPYVNIDLARDDVVISVYTMDAANAVTNTWPVPNPSDPNDPYAGKTVTDFGGYMSHYWALSDNDYDTANNANWQKDCQGNVVRSEPYYTRARIEAMKLSTAPSSKGFVAVELYHCYEQVLAIPIFTVFVPNPLMIHAYTIMPLPAAAPTPTGTH